MVHVTVGTGPPDEVQMMLILRPSENIIVVLTPAAVLGFAECEVHTMCY